MPHWATGLVPSVTCLYLFSNFSSFLYSSSSSAVPGSFQIPHLWISSGMCLPESDLAHFVINSSYLMLQMTGRFLQCLHSLCGYIVFQDDFLGDFILFLVTLFHWLNVFSTYLSTDGHAGYFQFLVIYCTAINRSSVFFSLRSCFLQVPNIKLECDFYFLFFTMAALI